MKVKKEEEFCGVNKLRGAYYLHVCHNLCVCMRALAQHHVQSCVQTYIHTTTLSTHTPMCVLGPCLAT